MKRIKTSLHNSLKTETLDYLMKISIEGKERKKFNFIDLQTCGQPNAIEDYMCKFVVSFHGHEFCLILFFKEEVKPITSYTHIELHVHACILYYFNPAESTDIIPSYTPLLLYTASSYLTYLGQALPNVECHLQFLSVPSDPENISHSAMMLRDHVQ